MLNAPSTKDDDRQAIPEYRNGTTHVWSRDVIRSGRRQGTVWFKARGLAILHKQEVDEAETKKYRYWHCHDE